MNIFIKKIKKQKYAFKDIIYQIKLKNVKFVIRVNNVQEDTYQ